jgi:outer membrane lipoprotein-sorting protein
MKSVIILVLILSLPAFVLGQTRPENPDNQNRIFSEIASAASKVDTFVCDFLQEKHMSMLDDILISKGRLYYKRNNRLRWEINHPAKSGFAVNGDHAKRWEGDSGSSQTFQVDQIPFIKVFADQVFTWARADFKNLEKRYHIKVLSDAPIQLMLLPISPQEKKYLDHLRISFAADASYVNAVEVHEPDGDFTRINFSNIQINNPLHDSLFN